MSDIARALTMCAYVILAGIGLKILGDVTLPMVADSTVASVSIIVGMLAVFLAGFFAVAHVVFKVR